MRILNATKKMLSIMMDNNEMMSIQPGQLSKMFIGSKNIVLSAVKLGSQSEIGIIYGSSYELEIARTVSVALPYLYSSEEEAIAKLIDKNVDYTRKPSHSEVVSLELEKANARIKELEAEVNTLMEKTTVIEDETLIDLKEDLKVALEKNKTLLSEKEQLQEKVSELSEDSVVVNELKAKNAELDAVCKDLTEKLHKADTDLKVTNNEKEELSAGLSKSLKQIEAMKKDFNEACSKFNLTKVDGEWVQSEE